MKKYFGYLLKKSVYETMIICISVLLINVFFIYISKPAYANYIASEDIWVYALPIVLPGIIMTTSIATIIVVLLLKAFKLKSKNYVDMYYALPISRKKLLSTHLLIGLIQVVVIFTVSFIGSILVFYALSNQAFKMDYVWLLYPVFLFYILILYGIFQFIVYRANNIADTIVLIAFYLIGVLILSMALQTIKSTTLAPFGTFDEFAIFPFYGMDKIPILLLKNATPNQVGTFDYYILSVQDYITVIINGVVYLGLAIYGTISTILKFKKDKPENIGGITTSRFGYKVLNPVIIFLSTFVLYFGAALNKTYSQMLFLPILVGLFYIMYFVYNRKFRLPRNNHIVMGATVLTSIIFSLLLVHFF